MAWVWKVTEPSPTEQSGSSCLRVWSVGPVDVFGVGGGCVVAVGWGSRSPGDGSCYSTQLRDLDVPEATFIGPDLTIFLGLDTLGLTAVGQHLTVERAVIECRMRTGGLRTRSVRCAGPGAGSWDGG